MPPPIFNPIIFASEFIYTILAIILCLMIYFKTKESYDLTKHDGLKYFRDAFLFFGLSYFLRFILGLTMLSEMTFDVLLLGKEIFPVFILLTGYISTMAIAYLIFTMLWQRVKNAWLIVASHIMALGLAIISFITRSHRILFYLQCALFAAAVVLSFVYNKSRRKNKKLSQIQILYLLIFIIWLINLVILDRRKFIPVWLEMLFQFISLFVFYLIYRKVSKWIR